MAYIFLNENGQLIDAQDKALDTNAQNIQIPDIIWVSSENVTLLEVAVPTRKSSTLEQSLPYTVEERLLCDIADMHFAWFATPKDKPLPLAAVSKDNMNLWSASLHQAGMTSVQLVPDIFLAPWNDKPALLILENRTILRTAKFQGISGSHQWVSEYLKNQKIKKDNLDIILCPGVTLPGLWQAYNPVSDQEAEMALSTQANETQRINLLQGDYGSGFGSAFRQLRHVRLPLIAMVIVGLLLISDKVINYFEIKTEKEQLEQIVVTQAQAIVADFKQGNPLRPLVNRRIQQLQDKLEQQKSSSWKVLEKATPLLSKCSNCVYDKITLDENGFSVDVSSFNSLAPLEKIFRELKTYVVKTKLSSETRRDAAYYKLNVRIEAKG